MRYLVRRTLSVERLPDLPVPRRVHRPSEEEIKRVKRQEALLVAIFMLCVGTVIIGVIGALISVFQ